MAGTPLLDVWKAHTCIVMKRSMASASAGGGEPLVLQKNKRMLFGDAKKMLDEVLAALRCTLQWCPRQESNLYHSLRRGEFYPLNYGGVVFILQVGLLVLSLFN